MPSIHLYQIADEFQVLDSFFAETEGEVTPELEDLLNGLEMLFQDKVENVCKFRAGLIGNVDLLDREIERLQEHRRKAKARVDWLTDYLLRNLKAVGLVKVETPLFKVAIRKNPASVVIDNEVPIPEQYYTFHLPAMKVARMEDVPEPLRDLVEATPSKTLIASALSAGIEVPGARLEQKERLEVK